MAGRQADFGSETKAVRDHIFPKTAAYLYQMLGLQDTPVLKLSYKKKTKSVKSMSGETKPTEEWKYTVDSINTQHPLEMLGVQEFILKKQQTQGLATALLMNYFLRMTLDPKKIVSHSEKSGEYLFVNINFNTAFGLNHQTSYSLDFSNLFAEFTSYLKQDQLDSVYQSELLHIALKILLFPIATVLKMTEGSFTDEMISILEQEQRNILYAAVFNEEFLKFLNTYACKAIADNFSKSISSVEFRPGQTLAEHEEKLAGEIKANNQALSQNLIQTLKHNLHKEKDQGKKFRAFVEKILSGKVYPPRPLWIFIYNLSPADLEGFSLDNKKEILKRVLINKIQYQPSLEAVFAFKDLLESKEYTEFRMRTPDSIMSAKGSGSKDATGKKILVGSRYNEVQRAIKARMLAIAFSSEGGIRTLFTTDKYLDFLKTHLDGYPWPEMDSLLGYFKDTESYKTVYHALTQQNPVNKFLRQIISEATRDLSTSIAQGSFNLVIAAKDQAVAATNTTVRHLEMALAPIGQSASKAFSQASCAFWQRWKEYMGKPASEEGYELESPADGYELENPADELKSPKSP